MAESFYDLPKIISRERAEAILSPYTDQLCDPCFYGMKHWGKMVGEDSERSVVITPRVWAGIVHCYIVRDVRARFEDQESAALRVRPENESVMLIFDEVLVTRFKKVGRDYRPSNSPTIRQFQYERQTLKLDGLPDESTNITLGYLPNEAGTEIVKISAICWRIHKLEWVITLYDAEEGALPLFGPIVPEAPDGMGPRRIIRPIVEPKKAEGQGE